MSFDAHKNFAYSSVQVAPSPAASGTSLTIGTGDGALLPAAPFNMTVWPTNALALASTSEIIRVTSIAGDVLTIVRAQEGTSARTIVVGDQIAATITAKTLTDVEGAAAGVNVSAGTTSSNVLSVVFSNSNGVSFGLNGATVTGSVATSLTNVRVSAGTTSNLLSALTFSNVNGVSFGLNASTLTASIATSLTNVNVSAGTTSGNLSALTFSNVNGVSFGLNASTITASIATSLTNVNVSAGTTSNNLSAITFSNLNGVSFGLNGSTLTASVAAAGGAQTGISGIIVSDATYTSGTISFSNQANITIGSSVNGATQYIRLSGNPAQTNQSAIKGLGVSNTGNTAGNTGLSTGVDWVIGASGGITASESTAGGGPNTIWLSVANPVAQSVQTLGLYAVSNTEGASSSSTFDARTLSFQGKGAASVGFSNGSIVIDAPNAAAGNVTFSAGAASAGLGSVVFSNSNGVSFGLNGSTITASAAAGGATTGSVYATGNTTQNSSSTQDYSSYLFGFRGGVSGGFSGGTVQISAPPTSSLVGSWGVSLSTNGSTITVSGWTTPEFEPYPLLNANSTTFLPALGSIYMQPFFLPANISGGRFNRMTAFGATDSVLRDSSANFASNTTGSKGMRFQYSNVLGLYSLGAGTNSTRLESFWSSQFSMELSHTVSVSTGGATNISVSVGATVSYIKAIDSAGGVTTTTTNNSSTITTASSALGTTAVTSILSSIRNMFASSVLLPVPVNTTITPGQYWMAEFYSTASTTGGTSANALSIVHRVGLSGNSLTAYRNFASTAASSGSQVYPGQGVFSGTSAALPATMAFSDIRTIAGQVIQYVNYVNSAIS